MIIKSTIFAILLTTTFHASANDEKVSLQFMKADIRDVISFYEKLTGVTALYSNQMMGTFDFSVLEPVAKERAIGLIEEVLALNGIHVVQRDAKSVFVTSIGLNPKSLGVPLIQKVEDFPATDRVVMFPIKVQHRNPTEIAQMIQSGILSPNSYTTVMPDPHSGTVLVTERVSVIRNLIETVKLLDVKEVTFPGIQKVSFQILDPKNVSPSVGADAQKPATSVTHEVSTQDSGKSESEQAERRIRARIKKSGGQ